ncbi:MAG: NAD(P)-dependent dehydrogenase (short-subunit alcohol dehydrogenase family) [Gammaproteobacteria bacterium]
MSNLFDLNGRVAMVTGAGQGIGRRFAQAFAEAGCAVVVAELNAENAQRVAADIRATGARALGCATDVGSAASAEAAVSAAVKEFGRLDILVNNAGIFSTIKMQPFTEIPLDDWEQMLRVNITGPFLMARAAAPVMQKQNFGRIINMGSASVSMGRANYLHYTTSKSSLVGMSRSLARELGAYGITVNTILPGAVETEIERETVTPQQREAMIAMRCVARAQTPDDLLGTMLFLSSDASAFLTGQSLTVDGGLTFL